MKSIRLCHRRAISTSRDQGCAIRVVAVAGASTAVAIGASRTHFPSDDENIEGYMNGSEKNGKGAANASPKEELRAE